MKGRAADGSLADASVPPPALAGAGAGEGSKTLTRLVTVAAVLASYGLSRLIFNALGLRLIGAERVGAINIALSMAVLVSLPVSAGVAPALSRFFPLLADDANRGALRRWGLGAGAAWMALPAALFLLIYGLALGFPYGTLFAPLVLLWSALYALYSLCRAELFASDAPGRALVLEMAGVALFAAALLALFATRAGAWIPFSVYYLPAAAFVLSRAVRARPSAAPSPASPPSLPSRPSPPSIPSATSARSASSAPSVAPAAAAPIAPGEMRAFAAYSLLGSAAGLGIAYFTTVVVSATLSLASAGLWATLLSVAAPLLLAPRTLNSSFFPRLSLLGRTHPEGFRQLSRLHQHFASLLALGSVGGALVLAGPILRIAVGGASAGALTTTWTLVGVASYGVFRGEPIITACAALGRARLTAFAAFGGAGLCVALWALLLPRAGMPGVAAGYMAYAALTPVLVWIASRRRGPAPPVFLFPADAVFALIVALVAAGLTRESTGRIVGLAVVVVTLALGLVRIRGEMKDTYVGPLT